MLLRCVAFCSFCAVRSVGWCAFTSSAYCCLLRNKLNRPVAFALLRSFIKSFLLLLPIRSYQRSENLRCPSSRLRFRNCSYYRISGSAPSSDVDRRSRTRLWCRTRSVPKRCRVRGGRPSEAAVCCSQEGVLTHGCLHRMIPQGSHPIASPAGKTGAVCSRSNTDNASTSTNRIASSTSYEDGLSRR